LVNREDCISGEASASWTSSRAGAALPCSTRRRRCARRPAGAGAAEARPAADRGSLTRARSARIALQRHGRQILFLEASAVVNRGEKVGLVGPNGAGKTTIFRLITREEEPDDGQVSIDRGTTVGYFSQDIGEMKGRTVVEATLDGAGPVSDAARALHELEHALADPARANQMEALVDRYGEAQARFEELGGYG
jgi:ATPase subunit of ABC transporter with duplicated ATPase domains